jgi:hypothetical protein
MGGDLRLLIDLLVFIVLAGAGWLIYRMPRKRDVGPHAEVSDWITQLSRSLGGAKPPVETSELFALFIKRDLTGLVRVVKVGLGLDLKMRVGLVNSGGNPASPAWIRMPNPMPPYGTKAFKNVVATLYIRKEFFGDYNFESIVCAIAHEMSHVILEATGHPLSDNEKAVDLTAMLSGFAELYVRGITYHDFGESRTYKVGYLSASEVEHAASLMRSMRKRN